MKNDITAFSRNNENYQAPWFWFLVWCHKEIWQNYHRHTSIYWESISNPWLLGNLHVLNFDRELNLFPNRTKMQLHLLEYTFHQNKFKQKVGSRAKDYSNLQYWCPSVQKNKKWKSSHMGIVFCCHNCPDKSWGKIVQVWRKNLSINMLIYLCSTKVMYPSTA